MAAQMVTMNNLSAGVWVCLPEISFLPVVANDNMDRRLTCEREGSGPVIVAGSPGMYCISTDCVCRHSLRWIEWNFVLVIRSRTKGGEN